MTTLKTATTKKDLIDRIADETRFKRNDVRLIVQTFLDDVIKELSVGHRLEFRNFGVFELNERAPRMAQNPKTLERVPVPARRTVKFKPGKIITIIGDGHIYSDHINQIKTQLERNSYHFPTLNIKNKLENIEDYTMDDFELRSYHSHPSIKADMIAWISILYKLNYSPGVNLKFFVQLDIYFLLLAEYVLNKI